METKLETRVNFGQFEFDLDSGELSKSGRSIKLQAQPALALSLLVRRAGECVTRREIQEHIWGQHIVEFDQGLNYCISQIRLALRDKAESPVFIETVPRRGYRFIAPVTPLSTSNVTESFEPKASVEGSSSRRVRPYVIAAFAAMAIGIIAVSVLMWRLSANRVQSTQVRLAVLPVENIGLEPGQEYFSEGLTDELILTLSQLNPKQLGVIARTSVMRYKGEKKPVDQIGRELGVEYVLEGSVRSENGRARISMQLIRTSDQSHIWAKSYDRSLNDMLEVQRDVALAVAGNLSLQLLADSRERATTKPEVREAYLKARYLLSKRSPEDVERAIRLLKSAVRADPAYAPAHTCLARAYLNRDGALAERVAQAKQALKTAEQLDNKSADTHLLLGYVALFGEWNWEAAKTHLERAIALDPGQAFSYHAYAGYLTTLGRHDEAIAQLQKAKNLDPVSPAVLGDIGWIYYAAGRYQEAIKQSQEILELEPREAFAHECLLYSYLRQGKETEALGHARQIMELRGATPQQIESVARKDTGEGLREYWRWSLAWLRDKAGSGYRGYVDSCSYALIYADLGEREKAFDYLEKAYGQHSELLVYLAVEPRYDPLRSDPRFAELGRRIRAQ